MVNTYTVWFITIQNTVKYKKITSFNELNQACLHSYLLNTF